ncbi:G-type lectin S-receptor-like serine/threonine-protein kinase [Senna tora]|uniref:G-type lectin S-receptor-like serine/threonine-protein kinase n=1 Tax=Senna tora TaxID=362788 RepID=A0A834TKJ4_9FABA|nr:G-type lectin S-receptor-like serine/threonine-protein kinase [Senna tora]
MITPSQTMRDQQNETLVSAGEIFVAGFFTPENSNSRYLGIWYRNIPERTIVWVANREKPLPDKSGVLKIDSDTGILSIFDSKGVETWSSNASKKAVKMKPIVQLLDSGNLVVRDEKEGILWQSFDYPGDTFLPGMKIGSNLRTGQYMALTSWKTMQDPTPGDYSLKIDTHGLPQLIVTQGSAIKYRAGSWNGLGFTGTPELRAMKSVKFLFDLSKDGIFYEYELLNSSTLMRSRLIPEGYPVRLIWSPRESRWDVFYPSQYDLCESYATCGANTNCNVNGSLVCECLRGFKEGKLVGSSGCVRTNPLGCNKGDSFQKYEGMKLPDTSSSWYDKTINLGDCEKLCLRNCSCTAYSSLNISEGGGSGCLHWFNDIVDLRQLSQGGQDFYIRVSITANLTVNNRSLDKKKLAGIVVGCTIFILGILVLGLTIWLQKNKVAKSGLWKDKRENEDIDLPIFQFSTISNATNQFSESNKLGQGGFGPVYKAWRLWIEEKPIELMGEMLHNSINASEVLRCIQVGLLCVQRRPEDRPNMSSVVLMLNGERLLPEPTQPGFYTGRDNPTQLDSTTKSCEEYSMNEVSISLDAR